MVEEIGRLRAMLKPFADQIEVMAACATNGELPPDGRMLLYASDGGGTFMGFLNFGHVRAAAEAINQQIPQETKL
jgi:hypothetical protein